MSILKHQNKSLLLRDLRHQSSPSSSCSTPYFWFHLSLPSILQHCLLWFPFCAFGFTFQAQQWSFFIQNHDYPFSFLFLRFVVIFSHESFDEFQNLLVQSWTFLFHLLFSPLLKLPPIASGQRDSPDGSASGKNVSRTTPSCIILVCLFFVLALFIVYTRQCVENHPGAVEFPIGQGTIGGRSRMNIRGLDEEVIASFPTFFYSTVKELKIGKGSLECAVCLNEFADDERLRLLHKCSRVFHSDCIDAWLTSHSTCPVCRANLVPQPDDWDSSFIPPVNSDYNSGIGEAGDRSSPNDSDNRMEIHITENSNPYQNSSPIPRSPFRSCTPGWRLNRTFHRSHSTGHSLLPPRENYERFTLRLPEDVRSELLNTTASLNRARSCVSFHGIQSSRQGYRTESELEKNLIFPDKSY